MSNHHLRQSFLSAISHNKDGSHATQAARQHTLINACKELKECGFRDVKAEKLSLKHANALVKHWENKGIASATIKNRMSHIRWAYDKFGRGHTLPNTNDTQSLKIERRISEPNEVNRAKELSKYPQIEKLSEREQMALKLQRAFGLRREESLKIRPEQADKGDKIALNASWCKGGRYREVPIRTDEQRKLLEEAKAIAGKGSMIAPEKTYKQAIQVMDNKLSDLKIDNQHGFRHAYAQQRFKEISGYECPKNGGLTRKEMTPEQRAFDDKCRLEVSKELGHNRIDVTKKYLGS